MDAQSRLKEFLVIIRTYIGPGFQKTLYRGIPFRHKLDAEKPGEGRKIRRRHVRGELVRDDQGMNHRRVMVLRSRLAKPMEGADPSRLKRPRLLRGFFIEHYP
jgi:hypothetical protein